MLVPAMPAAKPSASPDATAALAATQPPQPDSAAQPGREKNGQFTRGNKGGPGNPFNRRVAALRQLLLERVSDDALAAVVDKLVQMAQEGDVAAARLVLSYTVGKPTEAVDPDRLDVEEFSLFCEEAVEGDRLAQPLQGIPVAMAC